MNKLLVTFQVSPEEYDTLKQSIAPAGFKTMKDYIKNKLFVAPKVETVAVTPPKIHQDWIELIKILEDDFLDMVAQKSGSRTNISKWAVYLLMLIKGESTFAAKDETIFPYKGWTIVTNPNGEDKPYWSDDVMNEIIVIKSPQGKIEKLTKGEQWYDVVVGKEHKL